MYRHELDQPRQNISIGEERKSSASSRQKELFAQCMTASIKRVYGGKLPSYAVIARDFSLRHPEAGSISSESIRKWMTGRALPHSHRLSALIDWLGAEIGAALSLNVEHANVDADHPGTGLNTLAFQQKNFSADKDQLVQLIRDLSYRDRKIILSILRALQSNGSHDEK